MGSTKKKKKKKKREEQKNDRRNARHIPEWEKPSESHMEYSETNPDHRTNAVSVAAMEKNIQEESNWYLS